MTNDRLFNYKFAAIYDNYVAKVERKGHTIQELNQVICWLTGLDDDGLKAACASEATLAEFFGAIPKLNPNTNQIKGLICGVRVEDIEDPLTQRIRYMDKLVDEVARGKKMSSILRGS